MNKKMFITCVIIVSMLACIGFAFGIWGIAHGSQVNSEVKSYNIVDLDDTSSSDIDAFYYNGAGFEGSSQYSVTINLTLNLKKKTSAYDVSLSLLSEDNFLSSTAITSTSTSGNASGNLITVNNISANQQVDVTFTITTNSSNWNSIKAALDSNKSIFVQVSASSDNGVWNINKKININYSMRDITITWKNWDGTVLETDTNVTYGSMPTYDGATPTRTNGTQERYQFDGWDKEVVPATQSETYTAHLGIICAYFASDTSRTFTTIEAALDAATSGTIVIVEPAVDANTVSSPNKVVYQINSDCEIKSGVTLVIPTDKSHITSVTNSSTLSTYLESMYKASSNVTSFATDTKYLRVTININSGVTLTNNGTLVVSGYLSANSGSGLTGQTGGSYSKIICGDSAQIIQNNDSAITHCYGYITESSLNNESLISFEKGKLYVPFILDDYRGFSYSWSLTYNSSEALTQKRASPFNQFEVKNISVNSIIKYNASVIGRGNFHVVYDGAIDVDQYFDKDVKLVGTTTSDLIQMKDSTNSKIVYKYDNSTNIANIKIYGSMKLNTIALSLSASIVTVNLTTSNSFFPISYRLQIELYSGGSSNATFDCSSQRIKLLPGSSLSVGSNCTLSGSEIIVYSAFYDGKKGNGKSSENAYDSVSYPMKDGAILKVCTGGNLSCTSLAGTVYGDTSSISATNTAISSFEAWSVISSGASATSILSGTPPWKIGDYLIINESLNVCPLNDIDKLKLYVGFNTFNNYQSFLPYVNVIANSTTYNVNTYQKVLHFDSINSYQIELVSNVYKGYKNTSAYVKNETIQYSSYKNVSFINSTLSISKNNGGVNEFNVRSVTVVNTTVLQDGTIPLYPDTSIQLRADVVDIDKSYNKTITWTSLNPSVATVSQTGFVTGVQVGTVTIQAQCDGVIGSITLTVNEEQEIESITSIEIRDTNGRSSKTILGNNSDSGDYHGSYSGTSNVSMTFSINITPSTATYASITWTFNASAAGRQYINDSTKASETITDVNSVTVHFVKGQTGASPDGCRLTCTVVDLNGNTLTETFRMNHEASTSICITSDTMITMSDGSQKMVKDLHYGDQVLVFNHMTGQLETGFFLYDFHDDDDDHDTMSVEVLELLFENGNKMKIITQHKLFDYTLKRYIDVGIENINDLIGHEFVCLGRSSMEMITTQLISYEIYEDSVSSYSPVIPYYMNYIANGMLNGVGNFDAIVNFFDFDDDLLYDQESMERDIALYGLYDYDVFKDIVTYDIYEAFNGKYLSISVGKGLCTFEEIIEHIQADVEFYMDNQNE